MRAFVFTDAALKRHAGRFVWLSVNTERIDAEKEGSAPIVEGVEVDHDVIVVIDVVAVCYRCSDGSRTSIVGDDPEVDRVRRIPDQNLGLLLGRAAVDRLILPKSVETCGPGPDLLVELPVDLDFNLETGDLRGGRALPLDHGGRGRAFCLLEQPECEHGSRG